MGTKPSRCKFTAEFKAKVVMEALRRPINDDHGLLAMSTIKCNVSGQDIKIIDSGQKAELTEVKPVTREDPEILDVYWRDEDDNKRHDHYTDHPVVLYIQIHNYVPGVEVKFHFENEDQEDKCYAANYSGVVDQDGIVTIKDFQFELTKNDN